MSNQFDPREHMFVVDRPWGNFEQFTLNEATTVKVISVAPGQRLSLQTHEHRDEFWQILEGQIDVEIEGRSFNAEVGDRFWVPRGSPHRLGNSCARLGRVLEIAYGTFDEDDIVRIEDDYDR